MHEIEDDFSDLDVEQIVQPESTESKPKKKTLVGKGFFIFLISMFIGTISTAGFYFVTGFLVGYMEDDLYVVESFDAYREDNKIEVTYKDGNGEEKSFKIGKDYFETGLNTDKHMDSSLVRYFRKVNGEVRKATYGEFVTALVNHKELSVNYKAKVLVFTTVDDVLVQSENLKPKTEFSNPVSRELNVENCSCRITEVAEGTVWEFVNKEFESFKEHRIVYFNVAGEVSDEASEQFIYSVDLSQDLSQLVVDKATNFENLIYQLSKKITELS